MTNQRAPSTDTVEMITVEKIILSGASFVSSILGHGAHVITAASVPLFYRDPIISGLLSAPSTLTCDGDSFDSSPRASITYKWKKDTVDITDETNKTYTTVLGDIDAEITCEVTITNASGNDVVLSNGLTILAITDTSLYELDIMPINGLSAIGRFDVNALDIHVMQGMPPTATQSVTTLDAYPIFAPTILNALPLLNGDAENSDMSDWTMDTGGVTSVTTAPDHDTNYREGARFFKANDLGQGVNSQMSQEMTIVAGDLTDVDTGLCYVVARFMHQSDRGYDKIKVTIEAIDAGSSVLATLVFNASTDDDGPWMFEQTLPLNIPTLTRTIKLIVLFDANAVSGSPENSVYADAFTIELMKV